MKRLIALFLLLVIAVHGQDAATIKAQVLIQIPNNTTRQITPANVRTAFGDVIDGVGSGSFTITGIISATSVSASTYLGNGGSLSVTTSGSTVSRDLAHRFSDVVNIADFVTGACSGADVSQFINQIAASTSSNTVVGPGLGCPLTFLSPTTYIPNQNTFEWNGSTLDMTGVSTATSTSLMQFTQKSGLSNAGSQFQSSFNDAKIFGPGIGSSLDMVSVTTHNFSMRNIYMDGARHGIAFGSNAYILNFYSVWINHMGGYGWIEPTGFSNYGENIHFYGGGIANSANGFFHFNDNGDAYMDGMSVDYNNSNWGEIDGGRVTCTNCHLEASGPSNTTPALVVGNRNGALFRMYGGQMSLVGTVANSATLTVGAAGQAEFNNVYMQQIAGTGSCFKTPNVGGGHVRIRNTTFLNVSGLWNCISGVSDTENVMVDGDFESGVGAPKDLIFISTDTATITNPVSGTNISLTVTTANAHTGAASLEVNKVGNSATNAAFTIAYPVEPGQSIVDNLWYEKTTPSTGNWFISNGFAKIVTSNSNTVPFIVSSSTIGTFTVNSSSATVPWTQRGATPTNAQRVPANMNYYTRTFNLTALSSGTIRVDGVTGNLF